MSSLLLAGATGLVGRECLRLAGADPAFDRIVVLARRAAPEPQPAKVTWRIVDFANIARLARAEPSLFRVDTILCALGTTIKQAGSQAAFREVDHDYPVALATAGAAAGARQFLLVSALGADSSSRLFYNRVKGDTERDVLALPYPAITIVRPSLLLGDRAELRPGERIAQMLGWAMPGRYKPVHARSVAAALIAAAKDPAPRRRIIESAEIRRRFRAPR
ncbi:MAG TPA: NAD(P)H-binding protein [Gemmatimonadaceae bacterium]|nr:NAD(P)H-binding protein [Gemmatimonadaceae bacterium]